MLVLQLRCEHYDEVLQYGAVGSCTPRTVLKRPVMCTPLYEVTRPVKRLPLLMRPLCSHCNNVALISTAVQLPARLRDPN
jgi:hypothetical protein